MKRQFDSVTAYQKFMKIKAASINHKDIFITNYSAVNNKVSVPTKVIAISKPIQSLIDKNRVKIEVMPVKEYEKMKKSSTPEKFRKFMKSVHILKSDQKELIKELSEVIKVDDTVEWQNGPLKFREKVFALKDGRLAVKGAFNNSIPLSSIRLPIKKVSKINEAVDADGKSLKVGDAVEFKADVEQVGVITKIVGRNLTLAPPRGGKFYGEYIGGDKVTTEYSDNVYKISKMNESVKISNSSGYRQLKDGRIKDLLTQLMKLIPSSKTKFITKASFFDGGNTGVSFNYKNVGYTIVVIETKMGQDDLVAGMIEFKKDGEIKPILKLKDSDSLSSDSPFPSYKDMKKLEKAFSDTFK